MDTLVPTSSSQSFLQDYRYAKQLMKKTTRGKNPDWYRDAFSLQHQLHLFNEGESYKVFYRDVQSQKWAEAPRLKDDHSDEGLLKNYVSRLKSELLPRTCRSLGIVLHIDQEASVFNFPIQDWDTFEEGATLESLIRDSPSLVLQDRTLSEESMSFRAYPTPGSPAAETTGTAIATGRKGENLLKAFRALGNELNFPIQTCALSSPLLLLSRLPRTLEAQEKPFCTMLRYEDFSFFGFYTAMGELILLKSVKHAEGQLPHSLESTLITTASSVELAELTLNVFDCRRQITVPLEQELATVLFSVDYQIFMPPESEGVQLFIELKTFEISDNNPSLSFAETETFGETLDEKYHLQDFLSPLQEEVAALPGALDMKILRLGRVATGLGIAACLGFAAYVGLDYFKKTSQESWEKGNVALQQSQPLTQRLNKIRNTEQYLADRSKGWQALELAINLFPLDQSVQFNSVNYQSESEAAANAQTAGIIRTWTIEGLASEKMTDTLVQLNSQEGIEKVFELVKEKTGATAFDLAQSTRNVLVNMDLEENSATASGSSQGYEYKFNLKITQRIEAGDSLSLPLTKI